MLAVLLLALLASQDWVGIAPKLEGGVVRVQSTEGGEPSSTCSGAIIAKGYVLTAAHCVPTAPEGRSVVVNKRHAEIARINYALDLAVLKVDGLDGTPFAFRESRIEVGTEVVLVGFAYSAQRLKYTFGHIADPSDEGLVVGTLSDAAIIRGMSGGALCDREGKLISINIASLIDPQLYSHLAVGVLPEVVREFVRPYTSPK